MTLGRFWQLQRQASARPRSNPGAVITRLEVGPSFQPILPQSTAEQQCGLRRALRAQDVKGGAWTAVFSLAKANSPDAAISTRMPETTTARKISSISANGAACGRSSSAVCGERVALISNQSGGVRLVVAAQPFI